MYELAVLLAADGVDLDELDATIPSLEPLWRWYVPFARADFPGIPPSAQPRAELVEPQGTGVSRAGYASELIAHYLFEVARSCFGGVAWVTDARVGTGDFQRTAVSYVDDDEYQGLAFLEREIAGTTQAFLQGISERCATPEFLADAFLTGTFLCGSSTAERCLALPRGASVLLPVLNAGKPIEIEPAEFAAPESVAAVPAPTDASAEAIGDDLVLAHITADMEALDAAPPIDLKVVAKTLVDLGFRDLTGAAPTAKTILAEDFAEFVRAEDAMVTTLVTGGELRALQVAAISPSAAAWQDITGQLSQLAGRLGARLAPEDEF